MWRRKAGKNLTEAKRNAAAFYQKTEQLMQQARGQQLTPEQKLVSLIQHVDEVPAELDAHDLLQEALRVYVYQSIPGKRAEWTGQDVLRGTARPMNTVAALLPRAAQLKSPLPTTAFEWHRYLTKLMEHSGREYNQQVKRDNALVWRASEFQRCQASTVRTLLRFLNGLFGIAEEEGWIQSNPFDRFTKRIKLRA